MKAAEEDSTEIEEILGATAMALEALQANPRISGVSLDEGMEAQLEVLTTQLGALCTMRLQAQVCEGSGGTRIGGPVRTWHDDSNAPVCGVRLV